jgi:hypothetical protein
VTAPQFLATVVFFGAPLVVIWRWIVVGRRFGTVLVWPMLVALVLWLLQAGTFFFAILYCIGGHCNPAPMTEFTLIAVMGGAYVGIVAMFVLSALRHRLP